MEEHFGPAAVRVVRSSPGECHLDRPCRLIETKRTEEKSKHELRRDIRRAKFVLVLVANAEAEIQISAAPELAGRGAKLTLYRERERNSILGLI